MNLGDSCVWGYIFQFQDLFRIEYLSVAVVAKIIGHFISGRLYQV